MGKKWRLTCGLALLLCGHSFGQSTPEDEMRWLSLKSNRREIGFQTSHETKIRSLSDRLEDDRFYTGTYEETLDLGFTGSVYHPNFLTFNLDSLIGLKQLRNTVLAEKSEDNHFEGSLFLNTDWLTEKPYGLGLFLNLQETFRIDELLNSRWLHDVSYGGNARWANQVVPLHVSVGKSTKTETDVVNPLTEDELNVNVGANTTLSDGKVRSNLDYAFYRFQRSIPDLYDIYGDSHEVMFENAATVGDGSKMTSSFRYMNLQGSRSSASLNISETLDLKLADNLTHGYRHNFVWAKNDAMETVANSGAVLLRHQLYESLFTTISLNGTARRFSGAAEEVIGPSVSLDYKKSIPTGSINLGYTGAYEVTSRSESLDLLTISDESIELADGSATFLRTLGVRKQSVVVTDEGGIIEYAAGSDYILEEHDGRVQIIRVPDGTIPNGARVLVMYLAESGAPYRFAAFNQNASVRTSLLNDKIGMFYRIQTVRYPETEGIEKSFLDLVTSYQAGVSVDLPAYSWLIEFGYHDSSVSPYSTLRIQQSLTAPIFQSQLNMLGLASFSWVNGGASSQRFYEVSLDYKMPINRVFLFRLKGSGRIQKGPLFESSLVMIDTGIDFQLGLLSFFLDYCFEMTSDSNRNENLKHEVSLGLTRKL